MYFIYFKFTLPNGCLSPEHASGAENGAEWAENRVSGSGAVSGHSRKHLIGSGAWSGRQWSRQRAKSAAQSPLTYSVYRVSACAISCRTRYCFIVSVCQSVRYVVVLCLNPMHISSLCPPSGSVSQFYEPNCRYKIPRGTRSLSTGV